MCLETSPYIKDLSNRWVTFDGLTVISCADHFCEKEREKKILKKVSAQQITVGPSKVTHRLDMSFIYTARFLGAYYQVLILPVF